MKWVIEQTWRHVLFLHWKIPCELLQNQVPFELDLFEGQAVISIVPFRMEDIRFPVLGKAPFFSKLWELNLRTYVTVNGIRGVYFLTLDTDSRLGKWIANHVFHLPYRRSTINAFVRDNSFLFESFLEASYFSVRAELGSLKAKKSELDVWATERYSLFVKKGKHTFRGRVQHEPWSLSDVKLQAFENRFSDEFGISLAAQLDELSFAHSLKVRFAPFEKIV